MSNNFYITAPGTSFIDGIHIAKTYFGVAGPAVSIRGYNEAIVVNDELTIPAIASWYDWASVLANLPENVVIVDESESPISAADLVANIGKRGAADAEVTFSDFC